MHCRMLNVLMAVLFFAQVVVPPVASAQEKKPYRIEELEKLLKSGVISDDRIIELIYENGLTFYPDDVTISRFIRAGANNRVIEAVRNAEHPLPPQKEKKPFYKKWWVMGAAAVVTGSVVALAVGGGDGDGNGDEPLPPFPDHP